MLSSEEVVQIVLESLNENNHDFMIVGSYVTNLYCAPRGTQDIDLVVESKFISAACEVSQKHPNIHMDPQLGFESVTGTKRVLLTSDLSEFKVEIFELSDRPHDRKRFERRVEVQLYGERAWAATAEDTIITKLNWSTKIAREKDIADARNVMLAQHEHLDWPYVERWCQEHDTLDRLAEIRTQLGV